MKGKRRRGDRGEKGEAKWSGEERTERYDRQRDREKSEQERN